MLPCASLLVAVTFSLIAQLHNTYILGAANLNTALFLLLLDWAAEREDFMKELTHVLCNLTEYESLGDQLCRIDNLCEKIGLDWSVDINYSVAKNTIVADVYSKFPEMNNLYKDKSLDETERILTKKAKEAEREYIKNVFAEAMEIVVQRCTKFIELVSSDRDRIDTGDKFEGWEYDFTMNTKEGAFYHLKEKNCWVYPRYENGEVFFINALNEEVAACGYKLRKV